MDSTSQYKIQVHTMRKHSILMALIAVVLTACGGGGGGSNGAFSTPSTGGTTAAVASVTVQSASPTIYSDNSQKVALTVYVRDANNNLLANVPVTYAASAGGAVTGEASTGTGGTAAATLSAISPTAATITVTATAGGKSGNATVNVIAAPAPPAAASMTLTTSTPTIPSNGTQGADITATIKDASNRFLPGVSVDFTATSGGLTIVRGTTDASGTAVARITAASDLTNRNITITARSGTITQNIVVAVTGTRLIVQGPTALVFGQQATFTVVLNDSGNKGISGKTITLSSARSNTLTPSTFTTDSNGQGTFVLTVANAGNDTITATGLGLTTVQGVAVNSDSFTFTSPATEGTEVRICESTLACAQGGGSATVRWLSGGQPVVGQVVTFAATRGTVNPATATTDATGSATTLIKSTSAGGAVVSAASGSATTQRTIEYVAWNPTAIALQASPFSIAPNEQSTVTAIVRDASGNLVKNQTVTFNLVQDNTGGTLSRASAITDSQGRAQTVYTAGAVTSGSNGVQITASVPGVAATPVAVTVAQREVFISMGTGNSIIEVDSLTSYQMDFAVRVTDASGAAVPNATLTMSILSVNYIKGFRFWDGSFWRTQMTTPKECPDEDSLNAVLNLRYNGILDPGEDLNGNGRIDAGNIAAVTPRTITTDADGFALVSVKYPQEHAYYVNVTLEARTTVQGTEYARASNFLLPGVAGDFNKEDTAPPGPTSPFGRAADCSLKD